MAINWDTLDKDFSGLTDGQNIGSYSGSTDIQDPITPAAKRFTSWGEKGRGDLAGYGTEGDTGITRGGLRDSSARLAIAQGWDGLGLQFAPWTDPVARPTSGQFGGILTFDTPLDKGKTMHAGVWMYVPADFDFRAAPGFLKTLRFNRSVNSGQLMEVQVGSPAGGDGSQTGWNLQDERFQTSQQSDTLRDSSRVLIRGQWNFIAFSAYLSDVSSELRKRLWVNDELAYEQIGETNGTITARWYDSGWQTANFSATTANGDFRTLNSATDTVTSMYLFTYWNGGKDTSQWPSTRGTEPYQDQALNIDSVVVHTNEADLGTDASGNKYIASTDVFPTSTTGGSPTLTSPIGTPTGNTTATGTVTTDKSDGTLYWEVAASATPTSPNATFISDATSAGDTQAVSATGSQIVSATGLSPATSYYIHFLHVSADSSESNIATSAQFTTQSLTAPTLEQGAMNPNLPVIDSTGSTLTLTFSEAVTTSAATGLTLSTGETLTYSSGSTTDTIVYTISPYAQAGGGGEILNFAGGANVIEATVGGTDVEAFSDALVSSQSTATAPVVVGDPTVDETGTLLTVVFSSASLANQTTPAHSPFTLTGTLGGVYTFTNAAIPANTGVFTVSPAVEYNDVLSLSFTQAGGTFTDGTTGIELATFTDAVVNNTSSTDNEPPVFTAAPDKAKTTISGHTIRQTINENGTVYGVRLPEGSGYPEPFQVKAGTDSLGAAAPEAKSVAAVAGQSCSFIFSSGAKNTTYDYYIVAEDSVPNLQETVVQLTATTDNLLFNGSGQGLPAAAPKKKVKMKWDDKKKRR